MNVQQATMLYSYIATYRPEVLQQVITDSSIEVWQYALNVDTLDGYNTLAISYGEELLEVMIEWLSGREEYEKCRKIQRVLNGEYTETE